jgi:hypothetical protein
MNKSLDNLVDRLFREWGFKVESSTCYKKDNKKFLALPEYCLFIKVEHIEEINCLKVYFCHCTLFTVHFEETSYFIDEQSAYLYLNEKLKENTAFQSNEKLYYSINWLIQGELKDLVKDFATTLDPKFKIYTNYTIYKRVTNVLPTLNIIVATRIINGNYTVHIGLLDLEQQELIETHKVWDLDIARRIIEDWLNANQ